MGGEGTAYRGQAESAIPAAERNDDDKGADERVWRFGDKDSQQRHEMLALLVDGLRQFKDPDPEKGTLAAVKRRLELAPTKEEFTRVWQEAIVSVATDPKYKGLKIGAQAGLYPIGRDPESKLWEFVHLHTGRVPRRDGARKLVLTKETGLILVLLPGGEFLMGAEEPSKEKPAGSSNVDSKARPEEGPIHEVALSAFLIGKYEVRQCEWQSVMGENPSAFQGRNLPVEMVTWREAKAFAEKLGLRLPSEAQWEYACRAGTTTPYAGTGELDEMGWYVRWNHRETSTVGVKPPNQFGLHDMHGNVWEWCEDVFDSGFYSKPEASTTDPVCTSGSGIRALVYILRISPSLNILYVLQDLVFLGKYSWLREIREAAEAATVFKKALGMIRVCRGGCYCNDAACCRSASRWGSDRNAPGIGLRIAGPSP